jgi:mannose-1-phosphate guanylyltransferase/MurNAc alpha-1-phosphate uridylyltransferase
VTTTRAAGVTSSAAGPVDGPTVVGIVLAAGAGVRLAPLTFERPKALCPVANRALVDLAVERMQRATPLVAVNVHHGREAMLEHLAAQPEVHVSIEEDRALGTAGAIGHLRDWIDGRGALVVNADAWCEPDLAAFVAGWDGERVRVLVAGAAELGPRSRIVASLLPASASRPLAAEPSGLYEVCWRGAQAQGRLEAVGYGGPFVDCGTPADYLQANLLALWRMGTAAVVAPDARVGPLATVTDGVVGAGAVVEGHVHASVVWPGAEVAAGERLGRAVRTPVRTVLVR